jgi:hypothetical protein
MVTDFEVNELCGVYKEMDKDGKKKMLLMAKQLLGVQVVKEDQKIPIDNCGFNFHKKV